MERNQIGMGQWHYPILELMGLLKVPVQGLVEQDYYLFLGLSLNQNFNQINCIIGILNNQLNCS